MFCFVLFLMFFFCIMWAIVGMHNKPRLEYFVLQGQKYTLHKLILQDFEKIADIFYTI